MKLEIDVRDIKKILGGKKRLTGLPFFAFLIIALAFIYLAEPENAANPQNVLQATKETVPTTSALPNQADSGISFVVVTRVIDGDTVEIEGGQRVRYIGIDTPETGRRADCFSEEASEKNRELVEGKTVRLERDVSETDRYGRLLRYIFAGDEFVNDVLVREGYATAATFPPDVKYSLQFIEAEQEARENNRGLWEKCKV
jgi:micrococcal nuclease